MENEAQTDVQIAHQSLLDFQNTSIQSFNPEREVVTTIVTMFQNRIRKLEAEDRFNEELKGALRDRLPEATWGEISNFLIARETVENHKIDGLLAPFIPKDGDRVPLLDQGQRLQQGDGRALPGSDKDKLQAVEALTQFIAMITKKKAEQIATTSGTGNDKTAQP